MDKTSPKDVIVTKLHELKELLITCQNHEGMDYLRKKKTLLVSRFIHKL